MRQCGWKDSGKRVWNGKGSVLGTKRQTCPSSLTCCLCATGPLGPLSWFAKNSPVIPGSFIADLDSLVPSLPPEDRFSSFSHSSSLWFQLDRRLDQQPEAMCYWQTKCGSVSHCFPGVAGCLVITWTLLFNQFTLPLLHRCSARGFLKTRFVLKWPKVVAVSSALPPLHHPHPRPAQL